MKARRGGVIPEEVVDAGLETLGPMPDSNRVAEWIIGVAQKKGSRT
jgi:hypothetical protein